FSITIRDENRDELSELTAAFNILTGKIEHLIYDVYEKKIELVQTQIQLLRSQVNPHFLYNTLDTIRAKALLSGQSELGDMALLLAGILRYGISAPGELVRVETEVDRLKEYLALQKHLYQNRFSENISIAPDVLDLMTIKFILQPLVENSLYHGLGAMEAPGTLEILGYRDGDRLIFQVTDNGVGITADALKELIDYMDNNNNRLTSIGLKNVHRRLRILYGNDYGVKIASQTGIGTVVTACLPIITQGDIKDEEHANDPDRR
ncbi:MAG: sensor histidine kinase, partial [Clostridia bacterium]|nr:sensor histidine kinase [Clostridia bacterium]